MLNSIPSFICYLQIGSSENLSDVFCLTANIRESCPFLAGEDNLPSVIFSFGRFYFFYLTDSYWVVFKMCLIIFFFSLFALLNRYVTSLPAKNLIAMVFCSYGWQDSREIIPSVTVGFLWIPISTLSSNPPKVTSKKLRWLFFSSSKLQFILGQMLPKSCYTSCMLVTSLINSIKPSKKVKR